MARRWWSMIAVGVVTFWILSVAVFAGDTPSDADRFKAVNQVQQGKQSKENDVQTRGVFSKKKKKPVGGAVGHSQSPDRTDPSTGDPGSRPMP